jgi:gliding motility-associated-like protein
VIRLFIKTIFLLLVVVTVSLKSSAQLCTGSLGDPIVNITFGAGPNPGPALSITKNLIYVDSDCPNDGFYTVRNSTSQCFGNTWHSLTSDHTGDPNGYFMLINASQEPSEFYLDTVKGLCPGTTYEFAAWIMNVILPSACFGNTIKPNLTFNIENTDGTVLKTYSTDDIPPTSTPTWNQYGFFFTTPSSSTNVVLRIKNNSTGGCGNDIAIDDITFRPCGAKLTSSIVGVSGFVADVCEGDTKDITMKASVSSGYNNPSFQWQQSTDNGSTWIDIFGAQYTTLVKHIAANTPTRNYLYRVTVAEASNMSVSGCRVASEVLSIRVNSNPVTAASNNGPVCNGSAIVLSATGGKDYSWTGVNNYTASGASVTINNAKLTDAGKYYVHVTSDVGCTALDSTTITVNQTPVAQVNVASVNICTGDNVQLSASGGTDYLWTPAQGLSSATIPNPVANPLDTTVYTVVASNQLGCSDTATVTVNVILKPKADAGPDRVIVEGQSVELNGGVVGAFSNITWSPNSDIDNIYSLQPTVNPINNTTYILTVASVNGCGVSVDSTVVQVYKKIIIPNAFSPNGDGINDTWMINALPAYTNYELLVFNRYGQVVFSTKNYSRPWDGTFNGTPLPVGTYYYLLDLKQSLLPKMKGYVVILR